MPHSLQSFFNPRSIAFVGATERSIWTRAARANVKIQGYTGKMHYINRRGGEVLGKQAATSVAAIGEPVDLALLMVPSEVLIETFTDLQAAGVRNAVVLSSGFAEAGEAGREQQGKLLAAARAANVRLLGPNCLGFVNFVDRVPVWTIPLRGPILPGRFAIVSQSGALAGQLSYFVQWQGLGLTYMVSTGNEADVDVAQVIDYLVDEPNTKSIALFIESVRDTAAFGKAAQRAFAAQKPIVVLKIGTSEVTAKAAQAHTGSLVGDDRVFDAACQRYGLLRVNTLADLIVTAELLARTGPLREGGLGVMSMSGGMCEIAADDAEELGVPLPELAASTVENLSAALPSFATPHNPLDTTGAVMLEPVLFEKSLEVMARDPGFAAVLAVNDVPSDEYDDGPFSRVLVKHIAAAQKQSGIPCISVSHMLRPSSKISREVIDETGVDYLPCGVRHAMVAMGGAFRWSQRLRKAQVPFTPIAASGAKPQSEQETLAYLSSRGVPVIPTRVVASESEAICFAKSLGQPVAMKIASPDIQHKTDIGGVALNVSGDADVAATYNGILQKVGKAQPNARIDGIVISPMRSSGVELFVGTVRDPQWGPAIAVGLGGIWVEALQDTSLRMLPVTPADVEEMLAELRGSKLLDGFRGAPAVDRAAVAKAIMAIGDAALALGPQLVSLEINPILVNGSQVEALDALAIWDDGTAT